MERYRMIKRLLLGMGLLVVWDGFGMVVVKQRPRSVTAPGMLMKPHLRSLKVIFPVEKSQLYRLVTAERLDYDALLGYRIRSDWFNERDRYGRTPLHYLIIHEDATVALVKHFMLHHGARYDIEDNEGDNPYCYGIVYDDNVLPGEDEDGVLSDDDKEMLISRSKLLNFIHSEMIADKLWEYSRQESLMRSRAKKTTFYEIT